MPALDPRMNCPPSDFRADRDLPRGFMDFYSPLHRDFARRQQELAARRIAVLEAAHKGTLPDHLPPSDATRLEWRIELPSWCRDQRNQMTGPADDDELVVKMLNSGAPGVMLDLEDSMANAWPNLMTGVTNIRAALRGELAYDDAKRGRRVTIAPSATVIWNRVRGLHLSQAGIMGDEVTSASLFDLALITHDLDWEALRHPLSIYIAKSESADEGLWWRDVLRAIARARGWDERAIKCMALVESHPLAYQMEEFLYHLRDHILGLNLGRWDYMASLIHFTLGDPRWVFSDRNTIPHDVPFFQRLRHLLVDICHRRGALAIGGMTALFPSREDKELNARALEILERDKRNEAACLMDGAWTGHPDQNGVAVAQFPAPNQGFARAANVERYPDLRPRPGGVGERTLDGTRAAARTVIRYRNGVLNGKGASLLDGYMEDLATDRIYRLMLAQRLRHRDIAEIKDTDGRTVRHDDALLTRVLDEELERLLADRGRLKDVGDERSFREARHRSEEMIRMGWFNPI